MSEVSVEATGETVGEAKWAAVRELERSVPGVDREAIRFQVVTEGERGLLGVGYTPARVIATAPSAATPPVPTGDVGGGETPADATAEAVVRELLVRAARALSVEASVEVEARDGELVATLVGDDLGVVIGRHGQMIDALQVLGNAIARDRFDGEPRRVVIDAAGYRARRAESLEETARRSAERAAAAGRSVALDPMSAAERRVVHEALKDDPEVETMSEGTEPHRYVVVVPRHAAD